MDSGLALVYLARGRTKAARSSIATALADAFDPLHRARLLAARVEIALAGHDIADARATAGELGEIASRYDSPMLHAMAHQTNGATLTYEDEPTPAIVELRKAVRAWTEMDAPFESAKTRRLLALAHRFSGDEASAGMELRVAKESFERLGAALEANRCDELIDAWEEGDGRRARQARFEIVSPYCGKYWLIMPRSNEAQGCLPWAPTPGGT